MKTTNYVPTAVGPTKLQVAMSYAVELDNIGKEKVCLITDIVKLLKLMGGKTPTTEEFYAMYENWSVYQLEVKQQELQVEWNSQVHSQPLQGQDF
jgi:hypothetical protein